MRKAMRNTIFGAALVAGLFTAGTAANAQRPGFYGRGYEHPIVREGFHGGYVHDGFARDRWVRPVGPAYGFGVTVGGPVVSTYADTYIPPCPGDGYEWNAGYYNEGVWIPGAWRLRAGYVGRPYAYGRGYERGYEHGYDRGFDRHFDHGDRGFYGRR